MKKEAKKQVIGNQADKKLRPIEINSCFLLKNWNSQKALN